MSNSEVIQMYDPKREYKTHKVELDDFSDFLTPKMSIKRKKLIKYLKENNILN